jgi:hypothetical protein
LLINTNCKLTPDQIGCDTDTSSPIAIRRDEEFRECFLTVYRGFAKGDDLLPLLIDQYKKRAFSYMPERDREKLRKK